MARVGVIGLGNIGGAVAANLVADGHDVVVADVDPARIAAVAGAGAGDVAAVAAASEITITSLPTPEVVADVASAWAAAAPAGAILLDLSTSSPAANRALAATAGRRRATTSSRRRSPAARSAPRSGRWSSWSAATTSRSPAACPCSSSWGGRRSTSARSGAGATMKLVNSLLAFTCTWVSLEGLSLAAAAGLDLRTAVEVVRTGGASNFFIDRWVEGIDTRGRPPQFTLTLAAKDARLIEEVAAASGVPAPVAAAVQRRAGRRPRPWASATTTGATSSSPPRPAPGDRLNLGAPT